MIMSLAVVWREKSGSGIDGKDDHKQNMPSRPL